VVEDLASQDGKRPQLTLSSEELSHGRLRCLAKVERNGSTGRTGVTEDASADGSRLSVSMAPGPALAALAVEHIAETEA